MDSMDTILEEYNVSCCYRFMVNFLCCCCMRKAQKRVNEKMFYKKWLSVEPACEPEAINW